ncbi:MAG: hypothetical protein A2589_00445 [Candidatus Vogelbacteria bacterium RIFOXYD1_FULL_46_19]|uniref:IPT/TIG domain-containing protein n=1 Tax=Candidatus Vogelbacteria bacterium RIFOXYD1_FULL_46_19 TaxID=1802439 RepID=A0A1G2QHT9_9BACT|nr:MAG: hypothetical protein A2589_00445 [Candidatus Vogelbacteria bacterium RIFOXYD1_FULL_46_19]
MVMKFYLTTFFIAAFLLLALLPVPLEAALNRNLSLGSSGSDVWELQKLLNRDLATIIAGSGPGSSGLETVFFGPLTQLAVSRFQEKYAPEVLHPLGLSRGTGYVGQLTRQKLNSLLGAGAGATLAIPSASMPVYIPPLPPPIPTSELGSDEKSPTKPSSTTKKSTTASEIDLLNQTAQSLAGLTAPERSKFMSVVSISPTSGGPGTTVTIKGHGFSENSNKVYLGYDIKDKVRSTKDGTEIKVKIENPFTDGDYKTRASGQGSLEIPLGIMVENNTGISNHFIFTLKF